MKEPIVKNSPSTLVSGLEPTNVFQAEVAIIKVAADLLLLGA